MTIKSETKQTSNTAPPETGKQETDFYLESNLSLLDSIFPATLQRSRHIEKKKKTTICLPYVNDK